MGDKKSQKMMDAIKKQMSLKTGPGTPNVKVTEEKTRKSSSRKSSSKKSSSRKSSSSSKRVSFSYNTSNDLFSSEDKKQIKNLLLSPTSKFEVEISFGKFKGNIFQPGLKTLSQFNNLKRHLDRMVISQGGTIYLRTYSDRVDKIGNNPIRRIMDRIDNTEDPFYTYQKKYRFTTEIVDNHKWGIRISKSSEEFVDENEFDVKRWNEIEKLMKNPIDMGDKILRNIAIQRIRDRRSYSESNSESEFYGMKFDLTTVNEIHIKENGKTHNFIKYEVEIERIRDNVSLEGIISSIFYIMQEYQGVLEKRQIIDQPESRFAVSLHNGLFSEDISEKKWKMNDPYRIFGDYWNKSKNIKLKYMLEKDFNPSVTLKLNGKRYNLFFSKNGTYLFNPPYDVIKVGPVNKELTGTLLDCEYLLVYDDFLRKYVFSDIYAFDIIFFKEKDVRKLDFEERLKILKEIPNEIDELHGIKYHTKFFFRDGDFYDRTQQAFKEINENEIYKKYNLVDGLILQPEGWYKNNSTYKWKDAKDLTIDFQFAPMHLSQIESFYGEKSKEYDGKMFWLKVGEKSRSVVFRGTPTNPYKGYVGLDSEIFDGQNLSHKIVECFWDFNKEEFYPRLIRDDRDRPNNKNTVDDIWEDIMNPIPLSTIKGHTLQLMRKYHNNKKLEMLSKDFSRNSTIIDIGSGRGGDLQKWDNLGMKRVYAIEPNPDNLKELQRRQKENKIKTNIEIMNYGAEKTSMISNKLKKNKDLDSFNGIVSFFSLTYFPKERSLYEDLLKTIDLLPEGSKFIGTVLDGEKVKELLDENRKKQNIEEEEVSEYITEAFTIRQVTEFDNNTIGNEIEIDLTDETSMVKNQTEWLFYFEHFRERLEDMGFELLHTGFINTGEKYNKLPESSKVFSDLNRSFVFQKKKEKSSSSDEYSLTENDTEEEENISSLEDSLIKEDQIHSLSENFYGKKLHYIDVIYDPSNFIHAVLRAISSEYYEMDHSQRIKYAAKIRKQIGSKLTKRMFKTLNNGELEKCLCEPYLEEYSKKDAIEIAFSEFKLELMNVDKWCGDKFLLEITSIVLGIDIFVLLSLDGDLKVSKSCNKLYNNKKSIILVTFDNKYYNVVGDIQYVYKSSSEFIKSIRKEAC